MPPFAESARIALTVREKLQAKHCARDAVQSSGKSDIAASKRRRGDHRIVLQTIRAIIGVAVIVRSRIVISAATCSQCNPETTVVVDGVAENRPGGAVASEASDADAIEGIEGDDVAFPCIHAADRPDGRIAGGDAAVSVAQRCAVNVGPDLVALDHYACRSAADKNSIGARVDYIAGARRAATDGGVD
jgi:hypothetical protein